MQDSDRMLKEQFNDLVEKLTVSPLSEQYQASLRADLDLISEQIPIPPEYRETKQVQSITDRWRPVFRDPRLAPAWDQIEDFLRKNRFLPES
jgi:hypothetical protein